jgi:hypothetical protein
MCMILSGTTGSVSSLHSWLEIDSRDMVGCEHPHLMPRMGIEELGHDSTLLRLTRKMRSRARKKTRRESFTTLLHPTFQSQPTSLFRLRPAPTPATCIMTIHTLVLCKFRHLTTHHKTRLGLPAPSSHSQCPFPPYFLRIRGSSRSRFSLRYYLCQPLPRNPLAIFLHLIRSRHISLLG